MAQAIGFRSLKSLLNKFVNVLKVPKVSPRQFETSTEENHDYPDAHFGGRQTVSMMAGDGIGPEMMTYVKEVFKVASVPVDFQDVQLDKTSNSVADFDAAIVSIKRNGVCLKGSIESDYANPLFTKSRNAILRVKLDLFANVVHCRSYPGINCRYSDLDLVVIRQNTGGEYAMLEHEAVPGVIECMKVISRSASERLARFAFDYAIRNGRKKVTCVHKANIQKLSDGLFLETVSKVAKQYPQIEFNDLIVDNTAMQLVSKPYQFDVLLAPNLYGLITQNIICGLAGGAGLFSGRNYGRHYSVFEPGTRNTGTLLDHNTANPVAMLNASVDMLEHIGLLYHASIISKAIESTLVEDKVFTRDLGGNASSLEVVQNVIARIKTLRH